MKILMVNKFLYPKGGAENYVLRLGKLLAEHGHEVQYFGLDRPCNTVGNRAGVCVSDLDFGRDIRPHLRTPFRVIYSREAAKKLRRVLEDFRPDVVHLNNIHYHLTPSVILAAHRYRQEHRCPLRIVYTAHDYQLICPAHGLFDGQLRLCEKCLGGQYFYCVAGKCIHDSRLKSILGMLDGYFWKHSRAYSYLDAIICPSAFLKSKLDTQSRFREKTLVLRNFAEEIAPMDAQKEDYVLEFGHLSRQKGTHTLLTVARRMPEVKFLFAGFGPAEEEIGSVENAEYVGFQTGAELEMLIRKAKLTVYPSQWHENCPYSVMESQLCGTPVLATRMGGIPELIREGETGELFQAGNADELERKLRALLADPARLERYAANCRRMPFESPEGYYEKIMKIYGVRYEDL